MYRQQFFPRLGDYIDTLLKVTKLTKSIVCVTGGRWMKERNNLIR